jgi:integrase/recombinase XerD
MIRFEITLDKRTQKKNGKYPLKLKVTDYNKVRFISLQADYTEKEYDSTFFGKNPKKDAVEIRAAADGWIKRAIDIEKTLKPFNLEVFRDLLFSNKNFKRRTGLYVGDLFDVVINRKVEAGALNTAANYRCSKNILLKFNPELKIDEITPQFLQEFESWFVKNHGGVLTATLAIYLRPLRAVLNELKDNGKLPEGYLYPFGRYRYVIPEVRRAKTTLKRDEIVKILELNDFTSKDEEFARDVWAFQFYCNGINLKDLIKLKWSDRVGESFVIRREKTKNTTRGNPQVVRIPITAKMMKFLNSISKEDSPYVLGFLRENSIESTVLNKKVKVGKLINKHLIELGERLGLSVKLTTKVTRDAYATTLKKGNVSIEKIAEMLGHSSTQVTKNYLDSFDQDQIHEINQVLP